MGRKGDILIGTSGYHYPDWTGTFYPAGTRTSDMLNLYTEVFPAVEINSTYYGLATPEKMSSIAQRLPEGYGVVVKTYRSATHENSLDDLPACRKAAAPFADRGIEPLFLAQFPQSFHHEAHHRDYVLKLINTLKPFIAAVEFRHVSWLDEKILEDLRQEQAAFVNVDEPALPGLIPPTAHVTNPSAAYVRMHGRNTNGWWKGNRYDYHYTQEELASWLPAIDRLRNAANRLFVFFNNCHGASAAQNSMDFARLLGIRLNPPRARQRSLFA